MADVTGIFAKIRMSEQAKVQFYREKGSELLTDFRRNIKAHETGKIRQEELEIIYSRQGGDHPMSISEYMQAIGALEEKYPQQEGEGDAGNLMIVRYDAETETLFYCQMFRWNDVDNLNTSVSLQTFLGHISQYKDTEGEDFIFFSDSATNLLESQFFRGWVVGQNTIKELVLNPWNSMWSEVLQETDKMSKKYYFDIVEKYTNHNGDTGCWEVDDEGLDRELEQGLIDQELLAAHG